jgi:RND family efflux transporter MFP subunit
MNKARYALALALAVVAPTPEAAGVEAVVQWSRRVELAPRFSGVIERVTVQAGERVARDQVLLALDETPFKSAARIAEATTTRRKLERDEAWRDYQQAKELHARTVLSNVELENARLKHGRAEALYQEALADLERANFRLRYSAIRAPYPALVLARAAEPGQTVQVEVQHPPLLVLAAADEYIARARLPAERLGTLKLGQAVTVQVGGRSFTGQIQAIGYDPPDGGADKHYPVEVLFPAPGVMLRPGQPARIELP